jgi:hypothetical protein
MEERGAILFSVPDTTRDIYAYKSLIIICWSNRDILTCYSYHMSETKRNIYITHYITVKLQSAVPGQCSASLPVDLRKTSLISLTAGLLFTANLILCTLVHYLLYARLERKLLISNLMIFGYYKKVYAFGSNLFTLYPRRGSRGNSDIPPRRTRFTKITIKLF